jgi:hypothetical protein
VIISRKRTADAKNRIICCPKSKFQTFYSLYEGTFFEQFKKPLFDILAIIKCWALELTIAKTIQFLNSVGKNIRNTRVFDFGIRIIILF